MTAAGTSTSSLEGKALASGCTGCDGKATYATITKVIFAQTAANVTGIVVEDTAAGVALSVGESFDLVTYAVFENAAPVKVDATYAVASAGASFVSVDNAADTITGLAAGETTVTATYTAGGATKTATFDVTVA